ncbi:MAG: polyprenyl synthetase family protein [Bacteroidales bacterium]
MAQLDQIKAPIKSEMQEFEKHFRHSMDSDIPFLNLILNYILRRKGKQMRPMFVFLTAKLTGNTNDSSFTAASLIELLHTATLIHDDVVDESYKRRGFFSLNALWKSKVSILIGDYLLSRGLLLAVREKQFEMLEIVSDAVKAMSEGELLQIKKSRKIFITEEEYFEIISKKTASLIASCTACGAKSANANPETINTMKKFGETVGLAFQIKDDILDYQNKGGIGKPTGNDVKEKKVTLPLINALQNTDDKTRRKIKQVFSKKHKNKKEVQAIIKFVSENNGILFAKEKMEQLKNEALEMLEPFKERDSYDSLKQLVDFTVNRNK